MNQALWLSSISQLIFENIINHFRHLPELSGRGIGPLQGLHRHRTHSTEKRGCAFISQIRFKPTIAVCSLLQDLQASYHAVNVIDCRL